MTSSSSNSAPQAHSAQPALLPSRKVTAGLIAGSLITIAVWVVNTYGLLPKQQQIPGQVAGALQTLLTFVVAYMVPPGKDETIATDDEGRTYTAQLPPG